MKTLIALLLLASPLYAAHRASVHLQQDGKSLTAYVMVWDASTPHAVTFKWTHRETENKIIYTTKRKVKGYRSCIKHNVLADPGTWMVIILKGNKEIAQGTYTVTSN